MDHCLIFQLHQPVPAPALQKTVGKRRVGLRPRVTAALLCLCALCAGQLVPGQATTPDRQSPSQSNTEKTYFPDAPRAINDDGVVIGDASVFFKSGPVGLVGPLRGGVNTLLVAVNNRGQVLLVQNLGGLRYFVCNPVARECVPIGLRGQVREGGALRAISLVYLAGLDDSGRVFGVYGSGHGPCAVVGAPTLGRPGDQGPPPDAPATYNVIGCPGGGNLIIRAMNTKGQITGSVNGQGFLWSDGKLTTFSIPTASYTEGDAINDAGVIAGIFWLGNGISDDGTISAKHTPGLSLPQKGFVYDGSQFRVMLNPRDKVIHLTGINNRGQVVGFFEMYPDDFHGFLVETHDLPVARIEPAQ